MRAQQPSPSGSGNGRGKRASGSAWCFFLYHSSTLPVTERTGPYAWKRCAPRRSRVSIGGAHDPELLGAPLAVPSARVRCVSDGEVVNSGPMLTGETVRLGVCARLELGDSGVDVVIASSRAQTLDVEPFLLHGLDVSRYELVGLKSSTHFRAAFTPLAARIITADEPGLASGRLEVFEARRTRLPLTPMWPISEAASYSHV